MSFSSARDLRFYYDMYAFTAEVGCVDHVCRNRSVSLARSLGMMIVLVLGFLISADTGMYSAAGFIIAGGAHLLTYRSDRSALQVLLRSTAVCALVFGVLAVLIAALMPHARFSFWTNS